MPWITVPVAVFYCACSIQTQTLKQPSLVGTLVFSWNLLLIFLFVIFAHFQGGGSPQFITTTVQEESQVTPQGRHQ